MDPKLYCFACMGILETEDQVCPHCGHDNSIRLNGKGQLPFSIIKNRYLIGKALGRGGFGVTYMGLDLSLDRPIAIKEYFPTDLVSRESGQSSLAAYDEASRALFEQGRERSMQEARIIARLIDVPDTVNVHDVFLANDTLYIVMEYIDGETLRTRIKREGGKLPPDTVLALLKPITSALIEIHRRGIIHRDVSPDNIMFRTSNGRAVLLDFGAAHNLQLDTDSEHSTSLKPGYAPVEQYSKNGLQDARTDEYALCATIYYAITGQKPVASMERAFGDATLVPPSALGIEISPAFEAVLMKGLSILAKDRYDDVTALAAAFHAAGSSSPTVEPSRKPSASPLHDAVLPVKASKGKKKLYMGLAIALVVCTAVISIQLLRKNIPAEPTNAASTAGINSDGMPASTDASSLLHQETAVSQTDTAIYASPSASPNMDATATHTPELTPEPTPDPASESTPTPIPTPTQSPAPDVTDSPAPTVSATAVPAQYSGYALTAWQVALRVEVSNSDQSILTTLPADTLVTVIGQVYQETTPWSMVETLGKITGYVPDDALRRINESEAQYYLDQFNKTPTPAPTPKPTPRPTPTPSPTPQPTKVPVNISIGDVVSFGEYNQNGYSATPIEWTVLDKEDGRLLLISQAGLETAAFHNAKSRAAWAECSLREWLNSGFLYMAFSSAEQNAIIETTIYTPERTYLNSAGDYVGIAGSADTRDRVFLLSVEEVEGYFPSASQRLSFNNDYLLNRPDKEKPFPRDNNKPYDYTFGNWLLRDIRADNEIKCAFHVKSDGSIASRGQIDLDRYVVRPALWVDENYPFANVR